MAQLTLLFIGDVFGKTGRDLVKLAVPKLVRRHEVTAVIANAENSAGGFGITRETGEELLRAGVHVEEVRVLAHHAPGEERFRRE